MPSSLSPENDREAALRAFRCEPPRRGLLLDIGDDEDDDDA